MKMNIVFFTLLIGLTGLSLFGQSEMSIEDMDNDGDATIELLKPTTAEHDLRQMLLGVNQSSEGFLRMVSNHDLSFWTNNRRRMTVTNGGFVGINESSPKARLHVGGGDIIAETQLRLFGNLGIHEGRMSFYSGDTRLGGLVSRGNDLLLESVESGNIKFRIKDTDHLIVESDGDLRVPGLGGSGTRNLTVDNNGYIQASAFADDEDDEDIHMLLPSTLFQAMFGLELHTYFGGVWTPPSIFHLGLSGVKMSPVFHSTRVHLKEFIIFFDDNDNDKLSFQISITGMDTIIQDSDNINGSISFPLDVELDQSNNEKLTLFVLGTKNEDLQVLGAKVIYQRL